MENLDDMSNTSNILLPTCTEYWSWPPSTSWIYMHNYFLSYYQWGMTSMHIFLAILVWFGLWYLKPLSTKFQLYRVKVLLVEETRVPGENQRPVASHWQTLSYKFVSNTPRHEWGLNYNISCDRHWMHR